MKKALQKIVFLSIERTFWKTSIVDFNRCIFTIDKKSMCSLMQCTIETKRVNAKTWDDKCEQKIRVNFLKRKSWMNEWTSSNCQAHRDVNKMINQRQSPYSWVVVTVSILFIFFTLNLCTIDRFTDSHKCTEAWNERRTCMCWNIVHFW